MKGYYLDKNGDFVVMKGRAKILPIPDNLGG